MDDEGSDGDGDGVLVRTLNNEEAASADAFARTVSGADDPSVLAAIAASLQTRVAEGKQRMTRCAVEVTATCHMLRVVPTAILKSVG